VRFESADGEVRFEASLVRGVIVTSIDQRADRGGSGSGSSGGDSSDDDDDRGSDGGGSDD
jgi:hypothetical protein